MLQIPARLSLCLLTAATALSVAVPAVAQRGRVAVSAGSVVEADGRAFSILRYQGGDAVGEVSSQRDPSGRKRISAVRYSPVVMQCEVEDAAPWIREAVGGRNLFNFAVAQIDGEGKVLGKLSIENAVLSRVEFPALEASSKDIYRVDLTFQPGRTAYSSGGEMKASANSKAKRPIASNFRVTVGSLDCSRVSSVGAFTISFDVQQQQASTGMSRIRSSGASAPQFGDLVLKLGDAAAQPFYDWHRDAVIEQKADNKPVTASIELLSADMKNTLFRIDFSGVGIFACRRLPAESERPAMAQPEMFVEGVSIPK
ncbi:MAG: hypothetical protein U1F36_16090 [Planctomycetota bacterium]